MESLINALKNAAVEISQALKYADFGYTEAKNATGDTQLKLDVLSDQIIERNLSGVESVKELISEEKVDALKISQKGKFIVAYDPLDGSSLVDVNFAVGSIFGIYENELKAANLKAAVYFIYGPRLEMVICADTPKLYRLDKNGEFVFAKDLKLAQKGKLNATGGTQKNWSENHAKFIKSLFSEGYRLRYSGAMVSDLHQILLKGGGLFSYPATSDAPNGKLRIAFEVLPFAYIFEKAGGATSDENGRSLLELKFEKIHATTPCFFGSKYEINALKSVL